MTSICAFLNCEPPIALRCFDSLADYHASEAWLGADARYATERAVAQYLRDDGAINGYCWLCSKHTDFAFRAGAAHPMPDWREQLTCTGCGLFCRMRLGLLLAIWFLQATGSKRPYITEQVTPAYRHLARLYPETVGSEFVIDSDMRERFMGFLASQHGGRVPSLRHEDVKRLSLASASIDAVLSFEVLEHVPDHRAALHEFQRVLKPGGLLVLSVPFLSTEQDTVVRAVQMADGAIEHLLEPEYHGDPIANAGCLAYLNFGWDILDDIHEAGFELAGSVDAWSPSSGIMGGLPGIFLARKSKSN